VRLLGRAINADPTAVKPFAETRTVKPACFNPGSATAVLRKNFRISKRSLGSGPRNRVHGTSSGKLKTSGSSEAWYRARFGTEELAKIERPYVSQCHVGK
jgi:hypothetical protein